MNNNIQFRINSYLQLARLCDESDVETKRHYMEKAKMLLEGYERKFEKSFAENYEEDYRIGLIEKYVSGKSRVCLAEIWQKAIYPSYAPKFPSMKRSDANEIAHILVDVLGYERGYAENFGEYGKQKSYYKEICKND